MTRASLINQWKTPQEAQELSEELLEGPGSAWLERCQQCKMPGEGSMSRPLLKRCKTPGEGQALIPALGADVATKVLSFLPLCKLYQLRLVSKDWNAVLCSPEFLRLWSSAAEHEEEGRRWWLVMVRNADRAVHFTRELIAYDSASAGWISLAPLLATSSETVISALGGPALRSVANPFHIESCQCLSEFMAAGGARGLVCFLYSPFTEPPYRIHPHSVRSSAYEEVDFIKFAYNPDAFSLLVLNLLTGSYDLLPPNPKHTPSFKEWRDGFLNLSFEPLSHAPTSYCVFLQLLDNFFPGSVEVYDSRRKARKVGKSCCGLFDARVASVADLNKADLIQYRDQTGTVFAYSVDLDEWSQVCVQPPRILRQCEIGRGTPSYFRKGITLVSHQGRVLIAAVQGAPGSLAGFAVYELCLHHSVCAAPGTPTAEWVMVARTPEKYWKGFYDIDLDNTYDRSVKFISSGTLICMTFVHYTGAYYEGTYYPPLVYDLVRDSWYHLPPYKGGYDFVGTFCLQPSFTAMA